MGDRSKNGKEDEVNRQVFQSATEASIKSEGTFAHVILVVSTGAIALSLTLVLGRRNGLFLQHAGWLRCALLLFGVTTVLVILYHEVGIYFFGWSAESYRSVLLGKARKAQLRKATFWYWVRTVLEILIALTVTAAIVTSGVFVLSNLDSPAVPSARATMTCPECSSQLEIEVRARKPKPMPPKPPAKQP